MPRIIREPQETNYSLKGFLFNALYGTKEAIMLKQ